MNILESMIYGSKGGTTPSGTVEITENGTYDVSDVASAVVAVPEPSGTVNITDNGTYDVKDKSSAVVNVPQSGLTWDDVFSYSGAVVANGPAGNTHDIGISKGITSLTGNQGGNVAAHTFYFATALQTVELPNIKSIGQYAFSHCTQLKTADIRSATSIAEYAFENCILLESINTSSVTTIATNAFYQCEKLTAFSAPEATSLGGSSFQHCYKLTDVNIPKVPNIYARTFANCNVLQSINLPSVNTIYSYAFSNDFALKTVDVGANFAKLGSMACMSSGVESFIIRNTTAVATCENMAFNGTPIASGTGYIYVPSTLLSDYQSATNWSAYQFRALEDYTVDGTTTGELDPNKI